MKIETPELSLRGFLFVEAVAAGNQPCALRAMKLSYPSSATWNHW